MGKEEAVVTGMTDEQKQRAQRRRVEEKADIQSKGKGS